VEKETAVLWNYFGVLALIHIVVIVSFPILRNIIDEILNFAEWLSKRLKR